MMTKWLVLDEDDEIRAICDSKFEAEQVSEDLRVNDIYEGFTPDEHHFVKARYVGDIPASMYLPCNWEEV